MAASPGTHGCMTAQRVLRLPEIVSLVLKNLSTEELTLRAAMLVTHLWADLAIDLRWRQPPLSALASLPVARRQYYASRIRQIDTNSPDILYHNEFRNINFPRLKRLSLHESSTPDGSPIIFTQYLQMNLRDLRIWYGRVPEDVLELLQSRCPLLEALLLGTVELGPDRHVTADDFISFLKKMNFLKSVELIDGMEAARSAETLVHLAGRSGLEVLTTWKFVTTQEMQALVARVQGAFSGLVRARLRMASRAVPLLVTAANNLQTLRLLMPRDDNEVLTEIAQLSGLRHLHITFAKATHLTTSSIVALGKLRHLQHLRVEGYKGLRSLSTTDEEFGQMIRNLGALRQFEFWVKCPLTISALKSLALHCPALWSCSLSGSYDISSLKDLTPPLFRKLWRLSIGAATRDGSVPPEPYSSKALEIAMIVRRQAPRLRILSLSDSSDFSRGVRNAFEERLVKDGYEVPFATLQGK